jgi:hypothetical protein
VQLALSDAAGASQSGLATKLLAPRPGGCKGRFECPHPTPIAVGADGFTVLLAGQLIEPESAKKPALPSAGSARSPDGEWLVAKSPLGLVVVGDSQELWKLPEAPFDAREAESCVVANDRAAIACVVAGKAVLLKR